MNLKIQLNLNSFCRVNRFSSRYTLNIEKEAKNAPLENIESMGLKGDRVTD